MISFKLLTDETVGEITETIKSTCECGEDEVRELLDSFDRDDDTVEYAIAAAHGCALVRVFDMGRYLFIFPIEMTYGANTEEALDELRAYAVKEEIPLVISDVPRDELDWVISTFRHMNVDAEDEGWAFRIEVRSECSLLDAEPSYQSERVSLTPLYDSDVPKMARLNRDPEVNEFWGYDYREDFGEVEDGFFLNTAREEFARGVALTLAVRLGDEYIGEAIYYAFDLRGSAEIGIRLLPEYMGQGLGSETLDAMISLGEKIGLIGLYATVDKSNKRSRRLMSRRFRKTKVKNNRAHYEYSYSFDD